MEEAKYKHLLASLQNVEAQSASYAAQLHELQVPGRPGAFNARTVELENRPRSDSASGFKLMEPVL